MLISYSVGPGDDTSVLINWDPAQAWFSLTPSKLAVDSRCEI